MSFQNPKTPKPQNPIDLNLTVLFYYINSDYN